MAGSQGSEVKILRCPAAVKGTKARLEATVMSNIMMGRRVSRTPEAGRPIQTKKFKVPSLKFKTKNCKTWTNTLTKNFSREESNSLVFPKSFFYSIPPPKLSRVFSIFFSISETLSFFLKTSLFRSQLII